MPRLSATPSSKSAPTETPTGTPETEATPSAKGVSDAPRVPRKAAKSSGPKTLSITDLAPLEDTADFVNVLWHGREGCGKSTDLAWMANYGRTVIINAEGGLKVKPLRSHGISTENILTFPRPGEKITFDKLQQLYNMLHADLAKDPESWAGVGMDSITEIAITILDEVSDARIDAIRRRGDDVDQWWTDRDDYNGMTKRLRHLLRRFRDLPCHFGVTALERRQEDEDTGQVVYGPAVSPALATDLLGYMDIVLACKAADDRGPFRGATSGTNRYRVKDRYRTLPETLANPTFTRILDYLDEVLTVENDEDQRLIKPKKVKAAPEPEPETEEVEDGA